MSATGDIEAVPIVDFSGLGGNEAVDLALARDLSADWFAPHTDAGFPAILCQDNAGGLEVRRADGTGLAAPPMPGTWVVNVADMLSRRPNKRWQSTPHRVKNLSGGDRFSCPTSSTWTWKWTWTALSPACRPVPRSGTRHALRRCATATA